MGTEGNAFLIDLFDLWFSCVRNFTFFFIFGIFKKKLHDLSNFGSFETEFFFYKTENFQYQIFF